MKIKLMNQRGGVYLIAGPPGAGKSTYLLRAVEAVKAECGASLKFMYFHVDKTLGLLHEFGTIACLYWGEPSIRTFFWINLRADSKCKTAARKSEME